MDVGKALLSYKEVIVMTRLELLTVLLSIQALLESDHVEKAKEVISKVIAEAQKN